MPLESCPVDAHESDHSPPFWTKVGAPGPDRPAGRVAILDLFNAPFVPRHPRFTKQEIDALRARGLSDDAAHAVALDLATHAWLCTSEFASNVTMGIFLLQKNADFQTFG